MSRFLFDHQEQHQKRQTVPNTLHGTMNQVAKSMFHAVVLAFKSESDFYLVTEDTAFGDFDDLVIVTDKGAVTAIQYKHQNQNAAASCISVNDTLTKSKSDTDYKFYKYYKSIESNRPAWFHDMTVEFQLATNRPLDPLYATCFDQKDQKFKSEFFNDESGYFSLMRQVLVASILNGNDMLNDEPLPTNLNVYLDYLECLLANLNVNKHLLGTVLHDLFSVFKEQNYKNMTKDGKINFLQDAFRKFRNKERVLDEDCWSELQKFLNKNVYSHSGIKHFDVIKAGQHPQKDRVLSFLRRLTFTFSGTGAVDSLGKDATAEKTKEILDEKFKVGKDGIDVLYNAFFCYCIEWLGGSEARRLTRIEIREMFFEWKGRYLDFQRWVGVSTMYQKCLVTDIDNVHFTRDEVLQALENFEESEKRALCLYGESGLGKTTAIANFIENNKQADSDYLLLDIKYLLWVLGEADLNVAKTFEYFSACRLIIFDNVEEIEKCPNTVLKDFKKLISNVPNTVRLVFLYRAKEFSVESNIFELPSTDITAFRMMPLDVKVVCLQFPFLQKLSSPNKLTLYGSADPKNKFDSFLGNPFYLKLLVQYYKTSGSLIMNPSSTDGIVDTLLKRMLSLEEVSKCRQLMYATSQGKSTDFYNSSNQFSSLVQKQIIVKDSNGYRFTHALYEECALRWAVESRLTIMLESDEDVLYIYREICRVLPRHQLGVIAFLAENSQLMNKYLGFRAISSVKIPKNSAMYYLKSLDNITVLKNLKNYDWLAFLLVDIAPIELLEFILTIVGDEKIDPKLFGSSIENFIMTVAIRCFCLSKDPVVAGRLYYEIVRNVDRLFDQETHKFDFYISKFFVDAFPARHSVGLMGLKAKLKFFQSICLNPVKDIEEYCFFQYVYEALVKSADSCEIGGASYPGNNCYFRHNNRPYYHGYITYRGKYVPFREGQNIVADKEDSEYQFEAMKVLVDLNIRALKGEENLDCVQLNDLIAVLNHNLSLNIEDCYEERTYIAGVIEVILPLLEKDSEFLKPLHSIMEEVRLLQHEYKHNC